MTAPPFKYDVFLSHNHADKPQVRRLAERLKAAGVRVWFDEWVIQAGDIIALKVDEGLELSRVLLLCISPAALASGWVALERSTAIHRDPANAGRRFIPLLLGDCALPATLQRYKYVDFREESEAAFEEVFTICRETPTLTPRLAYLTIPKKNGEPPDELADYLRRRRDIIEQVLSAFEPIHQFFFKVCIDYISLVEVLHAGLPASQSQRDKYYEYIKKIGEGLHEMHVLEGRLRVAGAERAVLSMQQYRLQATEVNDMIRLQQPKLNKIGVEVITDELLCRKDRLYKELAEALKA